MTSRSARGSLRARLPWLAALWIACAADAVMLLADEVQISVPPSVTFQVDIVNASASGGRTPIAFSNAILGPGSAVRISVKADGDLIVLNGPAVPASNVSWTTSNVSHGVGINGTLSGTSYSQVFESNANATSGGLDLTWTLSAAGTPRRAGVHQTTLRWKIEAVTP